ncbi:MAG TPA: ornithine cyclodeaminase family protein [Candidatus Limnocylindria bacterium]|nr:ornithine cyclodeaminase family protein [Candidatus Limnocylindria bacterium]
MALLLSEADVSSILTMPLALEAVESSFERLANGSAVLHPRQRLHLPGKSYLHYMAAGDGSTGYMGLKIYTSSREGLRFLVPLFHAESGDLVALLEADRLGQMRTGAASGVATRLMARADARIAGIIGTGLQARTQLEAIALVRKLENIRAYGRDQQRRDQFAQEMAALLGIPVTAVQTAEEAVRDSDIVITSTTATNPVVEGRWLKSGTHINAIGANFPQKRELDADAVRRCDIIAADSRQQSREEAGDLIHVFGGDDSHWEKVHELADIVGGKILGRTSSDQITLFKSNGIAIEDVVVAARVYELARARGMGRQIPLWQREARLGEARGV